MRSSITSLSLCIALAAGQLSCNFFGGIDNPSDPQDVYTAAVAKADAGDCAGARDLLKAVANPSDKISIALGWAYLCVGGATAANIASSLYNYSSTSNDLTVVGKLARTLLPMTAEKLSAITSAYEAFTRIADGRTRGLETAIAKFVEAAAIVSNQAGNVAATGSLTRDDISNDPSCSGVTCSTGSAVCTAAPGISDTDVSSFINAVTAATNALGTVNSSNLALLNLAQALQNQLGVGTVGRCVIYNNVVPAQ